MAVAKRVNAAVKQALWQVDGNDWNAKKYKKQLRDERFFLFAGENGRGAVVTLACLYMAPGISRIDDVVTHPRHRNKGCATDLMNHIIRFHRGESDNPLFLFSENGIAMRLYEKLGFEKIDFRHPFWGAFYVG